MRRPSSRWARGAGLHVAAVGVDPFPHAEQAAADARGLVGSGTRAVVVDVDQQFAGEVAQAHRGAGAGSAVLESVGEGLLHEPVDRQLHAGRHVGGLAVDLQRGVQSRGPDLFDERVELSEVGDGLQGSAGVLVGP